MRIRTSAQSEGDDKVFESSRHVKCQSLPQVNKKANQVNATHPHIHASTHTYTHTHIHTKNHPQSTKQTHFSAFPLSLSQSMTDWVDSDAFTCAPHVEKKSQNVLKTASEVYDLIVAGLNEPRYKKPKVDKATASVAEGGSPTKIKQMKQMMEDKKRKVEDLDSEIEDVTPSKKTKLEFGGSSPSEEEVSNSQLQHSQLSTPTTNPPPKFAQYTKYSAMKVDQLKDFLRWNGQKLDTKKDSLVAMVIDQAMHGRLGRCTQCEGKLNLVLETCDGSHFCKGSYSEEMSCFVACGIKYPPKTAPRFKFFDKKPTDEEMETIEKENKSMSASNITASSNAKIKTEVSFSDLDLATNEGKKEAATLMLTACRSIRVKVSEGSERALMKTRILAMNKNPRNGYRHDGYIHY